MGELDDALETFELFRVGSILPETDVVGRDTSIGLDGLCLDKDQAGAFERELAQMCDVVVGQGADEGGGGVRFGGVHAHGGHDNAVLKGHIADAQGFEEGGSVRVVGVDSGTCIVGGGEVGGAVSFDHGGGCGRDGSHCDYLGL